MPAMKIDIDTFVLGPLETNTYIVRCDGDCWVIDPSMGIEPVLAFLQEHRLAPSRILLTHGHGDHIAGAGQLKQVFPAIRVACGSPDAAMLIDPVLNMSASFGVTITAPAADDLLQAGQVLTCGSSQWKVLDTAGHTPGGVSYYCSQEAIVFTGDALFAGSIGRVDIPGGSAGKSLKNIRLNLLSLPDETRVLCGHGEETTIGREKRCNPFMKSYYK